MADIEREEQTRLAQIFADSAVTRPQLGAPFPRTQSNHAVASAQALAFAMSGREPLPSGDSRTATARWTYSASATSTGSSSGTSSSTADTTTSSSTILTFATTMTLPRTSTKPAVWRTNKAELFCFALVVPFGTEPALLALQMQEQAGIFSCDAHTVYSNTSFLPTVPNLATDVVDTPLKCDHGGQFGTQLNVEIFGRVWAKVIRSGTFKGYTWTVKVDIDCVFLPSRLRVVLKNHTGADVYKRGLYLNNCRYGLHGAIEVLSRAAVQTLGSGWHHCNQRFRRTCNGPCRWGEDLFLDQCFSDVLKVYRDYDSRLLTEDRCDPPKGWNYCRNGTQVAFHPFNSTESFRNCLKTSQKVDAVVMYLK